MNKERMIMDPIHGFINISEYPVIEELVDSKYFQRLRRLAQLGMTSAVYPNATHTRFAHCLGVMHVFLILFDAVVKKEKKEIPNQSEKRRLGAVAALLHDLGHGPFSHASESILDKKSESFDHEKMTREIISTTDIAKILKKHNIEPDFICKILQCVVPSDWLFISQLITSQLDADRLDYLSRDSYFTGVNYGKIDIHRIANTLQIWHGDGIFNDTVIIKRKGISAVEHYILGRHLMYERVYFHKLSRCMEFLLVNVFQRAAELPDEETNLSKVIVRNVKTTPELLYKMDDSICINLFHEWATNSDDKILQDLSSRILERRKFASVIIPRKKYTKLGAVNLGQIPAAVEHAGFDKKYYYIEDNTVKSAYDVYGPEESGVLSKESGDKELSPITHIMTPNEDGKLEEISSQSTVIQALSDAESRQTRIFFPAKIRDEINKIVNPPDK